jgi:hypothetical protein
MHWIESDFFRVTAAWVFMLLCSFLLLFSFGENGQATVLTFFYLAVILLLGLFLYAYNFSLLKKVSGQQPDTGAGENEDGAITAVKSDPERRDVREEFAGVDSETQYIDIEKYVVDIVRKNNNGEPLKKLMEGVLSVIANKFEAVQGIMYLKDLSEDTYYYAACYAYYSDNSPAAFTLGETLPGQVAKNQGLLNIKNVPEGYMTVLSGLGSSYPRNLLIIPFLYNEETVAVAELASFKAFTPEVEEFFNRLSKSLGKDIGSLLKALSNQK